MLWMVRTAATVLKLDRNQLLDQLLSPLLLKKERADHALLVEALAEYLELNGMLKTLTITELMAIAFTTGYFYRIFLKNNDVEIEHDASSTTTDDPQEP